MYYLALCCIARDEDHLLKEWLAYHAILGVEHFYIYDHCSKRPIRDLLGGYADSSRVTIRRIQGERMQLPAYDDCLESFGALCKWIGFLDVDEFVCPMQDNDLRVLLSEFEPYAGLALTWHLFGSSGYLGRPAGLVLKNYSEAFTPQESFIIKSIVQPAKTVHALNPHYFRHKPGHYCVNEAHYPVSPESQVTFAPGRLARINHYFMRSQQDYEDKLRRGRADAAQGQNQYPMDFFYDGVKMPCKADTFIQRFLPRLEVALQGESLPAPTPHLPADSSFDEVMQAALGYYEAEQHEKALACLCCGPDALRGKADLWTLRAMIAQGMGNIKRADLYMRQSLARESTETGFKQLRALLFEQGETELAQGVGVILRRYPEFFK